MSTVPKNTVPILLVVFWVAIGTWADTLLKQSMFLASWRFVVGATVYSSCSLLAFWTYRVQGFGWVVLFWNSLSLAVSLLLSVIMFGEPFTLRRRLAAALILAAILLTE